MLQIVKEPALEEKIFPFGVVEVRFPEDKPLHEDAFRSLVDRELSALKEKYAVYDRKAVFGEHPYFRFFRKFKKTYPVMLQLESVLKGRPFPDFNVVAELPFLLELTTGVLSGAHDIDKMQGTVELFLAAEKQPFRGLRGEWVHTYPGDFCARDDGGVIFSLIAGADERTCARVDTRYVLYPIFGTPDLPDSVIRKTMAIFENYIQVLSPEARIRMEVI